MPNKARSKADVLQGTLDLMVLQTLATLHGYAIAARLEQVSGGALRLNMGTLYPELMRLEQRDLVRARAGYRQQPEGALLHHYRRGDAASWAPRKRRRIGGRPSCTRSSGGGIRP